MMTKLEAIKIIESAIINDTRLRLGLRSILAHDESQAEAIANATCTPGAEIPDPPPAEHEAGKNVIRGEAVMATALLGLPGTQKNPPAKTPTKPVSKPSPPTCRHPSCWAKWEASLK